MKTSGNIHKSDFEELKFVKEEGLAEICNKKEPGFEKVVLLKILKMLDLFLQEKISAEEIALSISYLSDLLEDRTEICGFDFFDLVDVEVVEDPKAFCKEKRRQLLQILNSLG